MVSASQDVVPGFPPTHCNKSYFLPFMILVFYALEGINSCAHDVIYARDPKSILSTIPKTGFNIEMWNV